MACIAHINLEVVDLTFGEVCEAPQRDRVHRGKQEDSSGESLSVLQARKNWNSFPDNVTDVVVSLLPSAT